MELSSGAGRRRACAAFAGTPAALMSSRLTLDGGDRSALLAAFAEPLFDAVPGDVSKPVDSAARAGSVTLAGGLAFPSDFAEAALSASAFAESSLGMFAFEPSFAPLRGLSCFVTSLLGASCLALSTLANSLLWGWADAGTCRLWRDPGARLSVGFSADLSAGATVDGSGLGEASPLWSGVRSATELSSSAVALEGSSVVLPDAAAASPPNNLERNPITVAWRRSSARIRQATAADTRAAHVSANGRGDSDFSRREAVRPVLERGCRAHLPGASKNRATVKKRALHARW
jgi:hypothetical protein